MPLLRLSQRVTAKISLITVSHPSPHPGWCAGRLAFAAAALPTRPGPQRDQGARRPAAFSPRCTWRSSSMRWCTSCSMLVQASAGSCWVVGSSTAAAVPLSLSARRDSERASRSRAVIAFAEGGSGGPRRRRSCHRVCCAPQVPTAPEQRSGCRRRNGYRDGSDPYPAPPRRARLAARRRPNVVEFFGCGQGRRRAWLDQAFARGGLTVGDSVPGGRGRAPKRIFGSGEAPARGRPSPAQWVGWR